MELLQCQLGEEKSRTNDLQMQLAAMKTQTHQNTYRAKSVLLLELMSAQLYYAIRDLSEEECFDSALDDSSEVNKLKTKEMVLENTENLLEFLAGYLRLMSSSVKDLVPSCSDVGPTEEDTHILEIPCPESSDVSPKEEVQCEEEECLYQMNKTDDDKVVEFGHNTPKLDITEELDNVNEGRASEKCDVPSYLKRAESLKDRMLHIKNNLDNEALEVLQQVLNLDNQLVGESRKEVYCKMKEFLDMKEELIGGKGTQLP